MDDFDAAANALASRFLMSAVLDYLEVTFPDMRSALVKGFHETAELPMLGGDSDQAALARAAISIAIEVAESKTDGPKLTLVPRPPE